VTLALAQVPRWTKSGVLGCTALTSTAENPVISVRQNRRHSERVLSKGQLQ
jgi:hypothetical protein